MTTRPVATDGASADDIGRDLAEEERRLGDLSRLFDESVVRQAALIDIADLNLSDDMAAAIAEGVKTLKRKKGEPAAQSAWLCAQPVGTQLLLCRWIKDMDLLPKILD